MIELFSITPSPPVAKATTPVQYTEDKARSSAEEFETAFIAQMLKYSGLSDALTSGGGKNMQSFSQFYLEALAQKISDNGGFGIAERIYTRIKNKESNHDELSRL